MGCIPVSPQKEQNGKKPEKMPSPSKDEPSPINMSNIKDVYIFQETLATGPFGTVRKCVHKSNNISMTYKESNEVFAVREVVKKKGCEKQCLNEVNILKELVFSLYPLGPSKHSAIL